MRAQLLGHRRCGVGEAFTHRKEHVRSVLDARKAETRTRRIAAAVASLEG